MANVSNATPRSALKDVLLNGAYKNTRGRGAICELPVEALLISQSQVTVTFRDRIEQVTITIKQGDDVILDEVTSVSAGETIVFNLPLSMEACCSLRITTPQGTDLSGTFFLNTITL